MDVAGVGRHRRRDGNRLPPRRQAQRHRVLPDLRAGEPAGALHRGGAGRGVRDRGLAPGLLPRLREAHAGVHRARPDRRRRDDGFGELLLGVLGSSC
ncbi:hypothetical protein MICRO8M_70290 [Microbacterium sp. 8M]|nr:hypothetical protein MICRO8M_70290 [Microbacterium sp. 8M]